MSADSMPLGSSTPERAGYEFTPEQNQVIADLDKKMRLVGIVLQVFGVLGALGGLALITRGGFGALIQGVINIFLGIWLKRASDAFGFIVRTEGHDIHHLTEALRQLGKYFGLQYVFIVIGLLLLALALILIPLVIIFGAGGSLFS